MVGPVILDGVVSFDQTVNQTQGRSIGMWGSPVANPTVGGDARETSRGEASVVLRTSSHALASRTHRDGSNAWCHGTDGSMEEGANGCGMGRGGAGRIAVDRRDRFAGKFRVSRVWEKDRRSPSTDIVERDLDLGDGDRRTGGGSRA